MRGGYATIALPSTLATLPALRGGDHHDRIDRTRGVRAAGIGCGRNHRTRAGDAASDTRCSHDAGGWNSGTDAGNACGIDAGKAGRNATGRSGR